MAQKPLRTSLSIGGRIANQSIAKTAIEFYLYKRHSKLYITEIIEALKQKRANIYVDHLFLSNSHMYLMKTP